MVFSTSTLFKGIQCPEGENCNLTNCIFSHELRPQRTESPAIKAATSSQFTKSATPDAFEEPLPKRQRLTYDNAADKPLSRAEQIRAQLAASRKCNPNGSHEESHVTQGTSGSFPSSLTRPVSPPTANGKPSRSVTVTGPGNQNDLNGRVTATNGSTSAVSLNPKLLPKDPAGHSKRSLYLKHLHAEFIRLNRLVKEKPDVENKHLLVLGDQELVKLALDEEEKIARDQPLVYENIIKQRIGQYRKMQPAEWLKQVTASFSVTGATPVAKSSKLLRADLAPDDELLVLKLLVADQTKLTAHGYIPTPPTEAEIAEAIAAVEASKNYEICERCGARFQVFPERDEAGRLTSNGPCKFHPNRRTFPTKSKGDIAMALSKEPFYPCCNAIVGAAGCTEHEYHVFKSSSPARLAAVLPFIVTPENDNPSRDRIGGKVRAITFDCEMGYTTYGMELIRLTAVAWPSNEELVDVLVRPLGITIDLNSKFSGVWPEQFANAVPYNEWLQSPETIRPTTAPTTPPVVDSPAKARELLCSFLRPDTPLLGHAIDNDLNTVRLCHPTIVDTVLLYPHPRGLPIRFALRALASQHLDRKIQTGGERGHDSLEDAIATADLVRCKVAETWNKLSAKGCTIKNGEVVVPSTVTVGKATSLSPPADYLRAAVEKMCAPKRKRDSAPGDAVSIGIGVASYLRQEGANEVVEKLDE